MKLLCKDKVKRVHLLYALCIMSMAIVARMMPHLSNCSPLLVFSCYLGSQYKRCIGIVLILVMVFCSDILISILNGYALFGSWMIFCYSGYIFCGLISSFVDIAKDNRVYAGVVMIMTFGFWLWSNCGVWLLTEMYPHSWSGLVSCYFFALPFLWRAMLGSLLWGSTVIILQRGKIVFAGGKRYVSC